MKSIYVAIDNKLLIVKDVAGSWSVDQQLDGLPTQCLCTDPQKREILYCGTFGQGLWRSIDAGQTWTQVSKGIAHEEIMAVAVSPLDRVGSEGVVYAGTEPSALFRSENGGGKWEECVSLQDLPSKSTWNYPPRPWTHHVRCIGLDPHTRGRMIVCLENGALVRSTNGGATFFRVTTRACLGIDRMMAWSGITGGGSPWILAIRRR